jgi:hypothetical protein
MNRLPVAVVLPDAVIRNPGDLRHDVLDRSDEKGEGAPCRARDHEA